MQRGRGPEAQAGGGGNACSRRYKDHLGRGRRDTAVNESSVSGPLPQGLLRAVARSPIRQVPATASALSGTNVRGLLPHRTYSASGIAPSALGHLPGLHRAGPKRTNLASVPPPTRSSKLTFGQRLVVEKDVHVWWGVCLRPERDADHLTWRFY